MSDTSTTIRIQEEDPATPDIAALLSVHLETMHAQSPACSVHALDLEGLRQPNITFWAVRTAEGALAGCGALKAHDATHGEIKSMHIAATQRGSGLAQTLLAHIQTHAEESGMTRLSLETGSQPEFEPARRLYATAGFSVTGPFADYEEDPASIFMTRKIAPDQ